MSSEQPKITNQQITIPFNAPFVYTNGIGIGFSSSDVQLTATINGRPSALIAMPLVVAKSLSVALAKALTDYERRTGTNILDLNALTESLNNTK